LVHPLARAHPERALPKESQRAKLTKAAYPWLVNVPKSITGTGERERRYFTTKTHAETFCQQQRNRLENFGRNSNSMSLSPGQLEQAAMAFARLPKGVSLNQVVSEYLARHDAVARSVTFKTMFERFVESKTNKSAAYKTGLR